MMQCTINSSADAGASSATATATTTTRRRNNIPTKQIHTRLHILSATYGPAEGRRLLDGKLVDYNKKETHVPYTRDVLPFLRALISMSLSDVEQDDGFENGEEYNSLDDVHKQGVDDDDDGCYPQLQSNTFRMQANNTNAFPLMDGRPMNAVFGDPCPGTTKLLRVEYLFQDYFNNDCGEIIDSSADTLGEGHVVADNSRDEHDARTTNRKEELDSNETTMHSRKHRRHHCSVSRIFQSTFREHERVLLKRQDPLFRLITDANDDTTSSEVEEQQQQTKSMEMKSDNGTSCESAMDLAAPGLIPISSSPTSQSSSSSLHIQSQLYPSLAASPSASPPSSPPSKKQWRLAPTTAEITLPIILPFLTVFQRAMCQLVCSSWRDIVLEKGIAIVVDVNDTSLFPKDLMNFVAPIMTSTHLRNNPQSISSRSPSLRAVYNNEFTANNNSPPTSLPEQNHPSFRSLLRGLLNHSHSSLEALVLNDFIPLQPLIDLHPALPYLRKLKRLDISRIPAITDMTLHLISTYIGERLEVLCEFDYFVITSKRATR